MTDASQAPQSNPDPAKKPISPLRNGIGLVVLLVALGAGYFQYQAVSAYNRAVTVLGDRMGQEDADLPTEQEVEGLIGKTADGPALNDAQGSLVKTYSWQGLLKKYTIFAYYNKQTEPRLLRIETEQPLEAPSASPPTAAPSDFAPGPGSAPPSDSSAPPAEPKAEAPAEPKVEAPAEPKVEAPAEPKVEAPAEPKAEPKAE